MREEKELTYVESGNIHPLQERDDPPSQDQDKLTIYCKLFTDKQEKMAS